MKRTDILFMLACTLLASSCQNKELLSTGGGRMSGEEVHVRINWAPGLNAPRNDGMRINIFSLDEGGLHYGRADVPYNGQKVRLEHGSSHRTYAYSYVGNNVRFRNETDSLRIEATSSMLTRTTYSRAFPDEPTISGINGDMHLGVNSSYTVDREQESNIIDVHPEDIVTTYTFELRGITGAEFIRGARGGISGFSASYFMATGELSASPSTLLFDAATNVSGGTVTGSFRTFGRMPNSENNLTIEILYPSNTPGGGIIQKTWDVTSQISGGSTRIVIENTGLEIPDEGGEEADGWAVDLGNWNDVTVPLD